MPLRDDILNPIPGDNPSGPDLKYNPVYDQIKEARREEEDAEQGIWQRQRKTADYPQVIKLASAALATQTKDLQLAAWLTEALAHRERFAGLQQGLTLILDLSTRFWDTIHPEIEDGDAEIRAMPLAWVATRLDPVIRDIPLTAQGFGWRQYRDSRAIPTEEQANSDEGKLNARKAAIADGKPTPEEVDAAVEATGRPFFETLTGQLRVLVETVQNLEKFCEEKFSDKRNRDIAPSFRPLRECLEQVSNTVRILFLAKGGPAEEEAEPEEEAPVEEEQLAPVEEAAPVAHAAKPAAKRGTQGVEPADREDAVARLCAIANWLRKQEPASPAPYLILRALRWGELRAAWPNLDLMLLDAPTTEIRQELKRLSLEGNWQAALDAAESAAGKPCGRGWLDLQRYAVTACRALGYHAAASAILSDLTALLADFPSLLDATLLDDTQAANPQTREMFAPKPPPPPPPPPEEPAYESFAPHQMKQEEAHAPGEPAVPDDEQLIEDAIRGGRTAEAIELVTQRLGQETSGRGRFHRRVQLAQVCMAAGREAIAYNILRELAGEIEERKLEQWEPAAIVGHPLALLYRSMERNGAAQEEKERIYKTICRVDPMQALDLSR